MSNDSATSARSPALGLHRRDRVALALCGAWFLVATVWGFTGTLRLIPEPSRLHIAIKLHGVAFAAWVLLFALQATLAACHRFGWHRRIGWTFVPILAVMLPTGYWTVLRAMVLDRRTIAEGALLLATLSLGFALVAVGVSMRRRSEPLHAISMLLATVCFTSLAVDRVSFLAGFSDMPWLVTLVRIAPAAVMAVLSWLQRRPRDAVLAGAVAGALVAIDVIGTAQAPPG